MIINRDSTADGTSELSKLKTIIYAIWYFAYDMTLYKNIGIGGIGDILVGFFKDGLLI